MRDVDIKTEKNVLDQPFCPLTFFTRILSSPMQRLRGAALVGCLCLSLSSLAAGGGSDFTVDCAKVRGTISPALDINQWSMDRAGELSRIPIHSVRIWRSVCGPKAGKKSVFTGWEGVDDPDRYSFGHTDEVIGSILSNGAEPFLQIHASDFLVPKTERERIIFARACGNLIRHLNDGPEKWAPRHFGVKYVELWNEPNLGGYFDGGTRDDFNKIYEAWSKEMRAADPSVKIGAAGYAVQENKEWEDSLLGFVKKRKLPFDFLSWHLYNYRWDYSLIGRRVRDMRKRLNACGLRGAGMIITEYNYTPWAHRQAFIGVPVAAQNVSTLIALGDTEVKICHRWTGGRSPYGFFHPETGEPMAAYWGYVALGKLKGLDQLAVRGGRGLKVLAGKKDDMVRLVIAGDRHNSKQSFRYRIKNLPFSRFRYRWYAVTVEGLVLVKEGVFRSKYFYDEIKPELPFVYLIELAREE